MGKLKVVIDGNELVVEKGTILLSACRKAGIDVPALCHHDALEPYGACRLCLVEITRGTRTRMTTSCNYPLLREGETVSTRSPGVIRARRVVLELLLARCPDSELLRGLAASLGLSGSRFPSLTPSRLAADDAALRDCILCGLCVRACGEAIGASAISFSDRGPNRRVASPFLVHSEACTGCGACVAVCPTGVIRMEDTPQGLRKLPFFKTEVPLRRCSTCGGPIAPEAQLGGLRGKVPSVAEALDSCPACRRKAFSAQNARWKAAPG
jgi:bidirectional [NiFe] hydrogenase diaphorase subunit